MIQITLLDEKLSVVRTRATELANTLRQACEGQRIDILGPYEMAPQRYEICIDFVL